MNKFFASISSVYIFLFLLLLTGSQTLAATSVKVGPCATGDTRFNKLCSRSSADNAGNIISNIIVGAMIFASVIALIFIIFGALKWISSGGDKAKIEAARNMIVAAIIGLILTLLSYFILGTVLNLFDIHIEDLALPKLQE